MEQFFSLNNIPQHRGDKSLEKEVLVNKKEIQMIKEKLEGKQTYKVN